MNRHDEYALCRSAKGDLAIFAGPGSRTYYYETLAVGTYEAMVAALRLLS